MEDSFEVRQTAAFLYGFSLGALVTGLLLDAVADVPVLSLVPWFAGLSALALALALVIHQRAVRLSTGRRWRRTRY